MVRIGFFLTFFSLFISAISYSQEPVYYVGFDNNSTVIAGSNTKDTIKGVLNSNAQANPGITYFLFSSTKTVIRPTGSTETSIVLTDNQWGVLKGSNNTVEHQNIVDESSAVTLATTLAESNPGINYYVIKPDSEFVASSAATVYTTP